jgi:hypothetical protein
MDFHACVGHWDIHFVFREMVILFLKISQTNIAKFRDTIFRILVSYFASRNGHIISQTNIAKYREKSRRFANNSQFGGLHPGHAPNQIGQDLEGQKNTMGHAKIGKLLRTRSGARFKSNGKTLKTCYSC